eukprot:101595_1
MLYIIMMVSCTAAKIIEYLKKTRKKLLENKQIVIIYGGYIHDNENKEQLVGRLFKDEFKCGEGGCGPHGFNKDILCDEIKKVRITREIMKSKNTKYDSLKRDIDSLNEFVMEKVKIDQRRVGAPDPGNTRKWINQCFILEFIVSNKTALLSLLDIGKAAIHLAKKPRLVELLKDEYLFDDAQILHEKISHIFIASKTAQKTSERNLADIFYSFKVSLPSFYSHGDDEKIFDDAIDKGWELIKGNVHFACVCVDPRFSDCVITMSELAVVEKYFENVLGKDDWEKSQHIFY